MLKMFALQVLALLLECDPCIILVQHLDPCICDWRQTYIPCTFLNFLYMYISLALQNIPKNFLNSS